MTEDEQHYVERMHVWYWRLLSLQYRMDALAEEFGADLNNPDDFAVVALEYRRQQRDKTQEKTS